LKAILAGKWYISVIDVVEKRKSIGFAENQTTILRSAVCRLVAAQPEGMLLVRSAQGAAE